MSKIGIFKEQLDKLIGDKFGKYSKYIIQERALPDLRDGLKPVQRRILFAMYTLGLTHTSAYKKSARVVGDVIGKYHPHGDTSVYEAMVRMSQEWKTNSPLIDMHGNKGSIDGDSPAAMRYTEARLGAVAKYLLQNIDKNLTSFVPNFDDSELEPVVLPALYPNLLVNGATGIAAGYATNIPPHNFGEVLRALIYVLENEEIRLSDLTRIIKGPDFPTGGILQSKKSIREAYQNGKGRVVIRSKIDFDEKKNQIIITEIPFETYKVDIVKQIDELIRAGKLPSLKDVRDDSDRQGLQITIQTKADINLDAVLNYLYKNTDLQKNYSFNMVVIKDKKPQLLGLSNILQSFSNFQIEIYTKLFAFELAKAQKRAEIVEGLITAISILDKVIKEIRVSKNKSNAVENLIKKFGFSPNQAEAIVNLRLYRLTSTDVHELEDEKKGLLKEISHFNKGLKDRKYLVSNIVAELNKILEEFPSKRKSKIEEEVSELTIDEKLLIQEEKVQLVVTNHGYVKRVSMKSKDSSEKSDLGVRDDDVVISNTTVSNMENLAVFTSSGRFFTIPVYKLSEHKWKDIGDHLGKYFSIEGLDRIVAIAVVHDFNFEGTLVVSTQQGLIKQTPINDLSMTVTKKGSKYVNLKENDSVVSVAVNKTKTTGQVISVTADCNIVRYELSDVPVVGLNSSGVKNITLEKNDTVVASIVDSKGEIESGKSQLIIFTDNGKAKRFRINEIKLTSRPSKGIQVAKPNKSNPHEIVNMFNISLVDEINILTKDKSHIVFNPTGDVLLTDLDSGLNNVTREGIDLVFNDLRLDFSSLKKTEPKVNNEPEEQKPVKQRTAEQKIKQLTLDNILDNI